MKNLFTVRKVYKLRISSFVALFILSIGICKADRHSVKIALDSAHIIMGKQTTLHIEIGMENGAEESHLLLPSDTITKNVEIARILKPDTIKGKGDGLMLVKQDIILQSFDSGLYPIGPINLVTLTGDTIHSNPLSLKVVPVPVDTLQTIHSFAPVQSIKSKWWDFLPDWLIEYWLYCVILILVAIVAFVSWLLLKKKVSVPFLPKSKPISPFDAAMTSLDNLRDKHLCENGLEKEYYTDLTDILRIYLEGRFGINAMEMTSTQILNTLGQNPEVSVHKDLVRRILEVADYVKFAKVRPLPDDNVAAWENARKFVVDTKPAPETTDEASEKR